MTEESVSNVGEVDEPCENCGILLRYLVFSDGVRNGPWQPHIDIWGEHGHVAHKPERCHQARQVAATVPNPRLLVSTGFGEFSVVRDYRGWLP